MPFGEFASEDEHFELFDEEVFEVLPAEVLEKPAQVLEQEVAVSQLYAELDGQADDLAEFVVSILIYLLVNDLDTFLFELTLYR